MIWKVIGQSVIGSSHIQAGKDCEDSLNYQLITANPADEVLVCFVSDGAGSARHAATASETAVGQATETTRDLLLKEIEIDEGTLLLLAESIYDELLKLAKAAGEAVNEFSCTLMGVIIFPHKACFLQIGDGAIVRNDGSGFFAPVWWPHNGEYQNTTSFLIDDPEMKNLKIKIINESVSEVAIFTDGLQMLALVNESESVHQPFFNNLFKWLRKVTNGEQLAILNNKLKDYLSGDVINGRTDDDKTLFLATKVNDEKPGL